MTCPRLLSVWNGSENQARHGSALFQVFMDPGYFCKRPEPLLMVKACHGQFQYFPDEAALASCVEHRYIRLMQKAAIQILDGLWLALAIATLWRAYYGA